MNLSTTRDSSTNTMGDINIYIFFCGIPNIFVCGGPKKIVGRYALFILCHRRPILGIHSLTKGLPDTQKWVFQDGKDTQTDNGTLGANSVFKISSNNTGCPSSVQIVLSKNVMSSTHPEYILQRLNIDSHPFLLTINLYLLILCC